MKSPSISTRQQAKTRGRTLSKVALVLLGVTLLFLLVANFVVLKSYQDLTLSRVQKALEQDAKGFSYYLSERENDLRALANSPVVESYFANQSMGMSLEYGLQASISAVGRVFEQKRVAGKMGGKEIFDSLQLVDRRGVVIASSPLDAARTHGEGITWSGESPPAVRGSANSSGGIVVTSPVHQSGRLQGYVLGHLKHHAALSFLVNGNTELVLLLDERSVIYISHPEATIDGRRLRELTSKGETPAEIESTLVLSSGALFSENEPLTAYFTQIPGYPFVLYHLDQSDRVRGKRTQLVFKVSMLILTVGAFLAGILFLKAGARNLVLETVLRETEKKNVEVAEKAEQLELVINGAGLGVWKWDISDRELFHNGRWGEILGRTQGEGSISTDTLQGLLHPEDRERVFLAIAQSFYEAESSYSSEHRLRHQDGHWVWVRETGKVMERDPDGRALHAFGILQDITKEKTARQILAAAKEESDRIIRGFLDTLLVVDTGLKVVRVNPATCSMLGQAEDILLGRDIAELFHDPREHVHKVFSFYRQADQAHVPPALEELRNIELCYRDVRGVRLPMSFNLSLLRNESGEVAGIVAGAKDISKIRQVIDELARQKEYIETLFDIVPEGLLALSGDGRIVKTNRVCEEILDNWTTLLALSKQELQRVLVREVSARHDAGKSSFTFAVRAAANQVVFCKCSAVIITGLEGVSLLVSLADITQERFIQEEKKLLATIIEQTDESVIITGTDMVIRYVNPAVMRNSGFSKEELLGNTPAIFKSGLVAESVYVEMFRTLEQGQVWSGRLRNRRKSGAIVEEDVKISPVLNEEGKINHYVAIKRDMTEVANLQRQLLQAQKLEAIGHLAAGIAHEINTPMQYVQNNITFFGQAFEDVRRLFEELARTKDYDNRGELLECLKTINLDYLVAEIPEAIIEAKEGIDRVVKIVLAMKAFSHPGSLDKVATDINRALENTVTVCRNEYKDVAEVILDLQEDLPDVRCFPDQFNQAVLNLLINAAHAIEESGARFPDNPGRITLSTRSLGDAVEIRVRDSGTGIPENVQGFIFDPFFTTKEVGKGTGQGLTIVHDIVVQKHGGTLDFITEQGKGTTFVVRLPINNGSRTSL